MYYEHLFICFFTNLDVFLDVTFTAVYIIIKRSNMFKKEWRIQGKNKKLARISVNVPQQRIWTHVPAGAEVYGVLKEMKIPSY
jgi:hypothetical protein